MIIDNRPAKKTSLQQIVAVANKIITILFGWIKSKEMFDCDSLYYSREYCVFLYESRESAKESMSLSHGCAGFSYSPNLIDPDEILDFWRKKTNKTVDFCMPKSLIMIVEPSGEFAEVICENKHGWIIYKDYLRLKKVEPE